MFYSLVYWLSNAPLWKLGIAALLAILSLTIWLWVLSLLNPKVENKNQNTILDLNIDIIVPTVIS